MRWVVLTDDHPPLDGGVATFTDEIVRGLRELGREVVVLARSRPGLPDDVVAVPGPSFGRLGGWWTAARAWPLLRPGDRVLATTWPVATRILPLLRRLHIPLDVVVHGSDVTRDLTPARAVLAAADRVFAMSHYLCTVVPGAQLLPAPIDPSAALPSERPTRWGFVARATPLKGGDRFLRMAALSGARATVIGDGPELSSWRALANRLEVDVEFTGRLPRAQVLHRLPGLDLVMLLPRVDVDGTGAEGLGLTLLEAAAAGVATVGCRTGGVPEAVGPGLLLDDPDDTARSVAELHGWWTPERGAACRDWVAANHGRRRAAVRLAERI